MGGRVREREVAQDARSSTPASGFPTMTLKRRGGKTLAEGYKRLDKHRSLGLALARGLRTLSCLSFSTPNALW